MVSNKNLDLAMACRAFHT